MKIFKKKRDISREKLDLLIDEYMDELYGDSKSQYTDEEREEISENIERFYKLKIAEDEAKKNSRSKLITAVGGIATFIVGIVAYDHWNKRGLRFEETGSINSTTNRQLFSRMSPKDL